MPTGSHQKAIWIGFAITVVAAVIISVLGMLVTLNGRGLPLPVQLGALIMVMLLSYPASLPWWRKLDEMARQAHLVSWFWGAQLGGGAAIICTAALVTRGADDSLVIGAVWVLAAQFAVTAVIWAGWWLRRRGDKA